MIANGVVVRPAAANDVEALHALAASAGLGMTNLPACHSKLAALLAGSDAILADPEHAAGRQLVR
jgi:arginine N-succinyltransferase